MRTMSDTIARMARFKGGRFPAAAGGSRLAELTGFGSNPGGLAARCHVPDGLEANAALVVVLHGCTQSPAEHDHGTGWSALADREGFAVLYPEQMRCNNANLCFSWFVPADVRRGGGEVVSITQMVERMVATHSLDRSRIFITGLSAGGAMTCAMLATHPELFAGGAVMGGLPFACATDVLEAFDAMRGHGGPTDARLAASVRDASGDFGGSWPTLSIWHGTADRTVSVSNLARIGRQWRGVQGIDEKRFDTEQGSNWRRRTWRGADGRKAVEEWSVTGMGHGVPIDGGPNGIGAEGPYALAVGISSTERIAQSWGISRNAPPMEAAAMPSPPAKARRTRAAAPPVKAAQPVQQIIENALRAAGLMR